MPILAFLLGNWKFVLLGLLLAIIGVQTWRLDRCQKNYEEFRISVEALGRAQEAETKRIIAEREKAAKESENALKTKLEDISSKYVAARKQLRDAGPGKLSTLASAAPSLSSC